MSTRSRRASSRPSAPAVTPSSSLDLSRRKSLSAATASAAASARKRRRTTEEKEEEEQKQSTNDDAEMTDETAEEESDETNQTSDQQTAESRTTKISRSNLTQTSVHTPVRPTSSGVHTSPQYDPDHLAQPLLRTKRLEEKNELQELNKRLELYILRQRERDASQGGLNQEILILKEKFKSELQSEKKHHDQRYEELKKQKLDLSNQLQELQDAHSKLTHESKDHLASSNMYKSRCADLEKRVKKLEAELAEVKKRNIELENQLKKLQIDYQEENEAHLLLKGQLETQKNALTLAQKQLNVIQSKSNTYLQDLEALQASSEEEQLLLNKQLTILRKENREIEDDLRKEFGLQLKNLLKERQEQAELEKEEQGRRLKEFYETRLEEKTAATVSLQNELDRLTKHANQLEKDLSAERKNNSSAAAIRADYERQIAKLHEVHDASRERLEEQLTIKTNQLHTSQTTIIQKDQEFQQLMDVKIALDMEIAQYNQLLNTEENRLGFQPPVGSSSAGTSTPSRRLSMSAGSTPAAKGRKSTTTTTTTTSSSSSASSQQLFQSSRGRSSSHVAQAIGDLLSVSVNSGAKKITLTNTARIDESDSTNSNGISLDGVVLYATKSKSTLPLSIQQLSPGESHSIITPSGRAQSGPFSTVQKWTGVDEEKLWQDGETVVIKDTRGNVLSSVQIRV